MCSHVMCVSRGKYTLQQTCLLNFWPLWAQFGASLVVFLKQQGAPKLAKEGRVNGDSGWLIM